MVGENEPCVGVVRNLKRQVRDIVTERVARRSSEVEVGSQACLCLLQAGQSVTCNGTLATVLVNE